MTQELGRIDFGFGRGHWGRGISGGLRSFGLLRRLRLRRSRGSYDWRSGCWRRMCRTEWLRGYRHGTGRGESARSVDARRAFIGGPQALMPRRNGERDHEGDTCQSPHQKALIHAGALRIRVPKRPIIAANDDGFCNAGAIRSSCVPRVALACAALLCAGLRSCVVSFSLEPIVSVLE
jgi:hypothetical protein